MSKFGSRWQRSIQLSELNLLFPIATYDRLYYNASNNVSVYSASDLVHKWLKLPLVRVFLTYTALILFGAAKVKLGTYFIIAASVLFVIELGVTNKIIVSDNTTAGTVLGLVCGLMPLNFVLNVSADRSSGVASFLATVQSITIVVLLLCVVFAYIIRPSFAKAWSCYGNAPVEDYNRGPCPLYTNDYLHSYACRDNTDASCYGVPPSKSWANPRQFEMHCMVGLASLYGLHVANTLLLYLNDSAGIVAAYVRRTEGAYTYINPAFNGE